MTNQGDHINMKIKINQEVMSQTMTSLQREEEEHTIIEQAVL